MKTNTNPWMLATIFLFGLIVGFGTGRIGALPTFGNAPAADTGTLLPDNNTNPPAIITTTSTSYDGVEKSLDSTGHYSLGNKNAKVKIQEFSDFQCPFCYRFYSNTFSQILKDYIASGKVYYSFYNFPLDIHQQAPKAAEASLCAGDQNKYWEYHDLLFTNQNVWSGIDNDVPIYTTLAQTMGLDTGKFGECLTSNKFAATVKEDSDLGDKKEISGTPTLFINSQKIVGAVDYSEFKKAIEAQLK